MVAPQKVALVVRQRGGGNLMMHTRGILARDVQVISEEVVTIMGKFAASRGRGDVDGSGDNPPVFSFDKLRVSHGRYIAVYRLVNKVWVIAIAAANANPFVVGHIVESATKGLIRACQQVEVTKDLLAKHWVEAYFLLGAVLALRGANFEKAQVEAAAQYLTIAADARERKKAAAAPDQKRNAALARSSLGPTTTRRNLSTMDSMNQKLSFSLPDEVQKEKAGGLGPIRELPEQPGHAPTPSAPILSAEDDSFGLSELGNQLAAQQVQDHQKAQSLDLFGGLDDLITPGPSAGGASAPAPGEDPFISGLESIMPVATQPVLPAQAQSVPSPSQPSPKNQTSWAGDFFSGPTAPAQQDQGSWWTATETASPVARKLEGQPSIGLAVAAPAQQASATTVAQPLGGSVGTPLALVETWTGQFHGSDIESSAVQGAVQWSGRGIRPPIRSAKFRLVGPPSRDTAVEFSLKDCRLRQGGEVGVPGSPVLHYRLPSICTLVPVLLRVTTGVQPGVGKLQGQDGVVVLLVEYAVNELLKSTVDGFVDVHVPEKLGVPSLARPRPEWSRQQNRLRWRLSSVPPGGVGVLRAAFGHNKGMDSLAAVGFVGGHKAAAAAHVRVEAHIIGRPGATLSGVSIEQEEGGGVELKEMPHTCIWRADISARP